MNLTQKQLMELTNQHLNFGPKKNNLILATSFDDMDLRERLEGKAKKPYEWFQIFDQNDQPIRVEGNDIVLYRKECHGDNRIKGVYHRGANAFIVSPDHKLLVPIRSANKDLYPSMGDVSVSEHVNVRESYFDSTLRGFVEEQGVNISPTQLKLITKIPMNDSNQSEMCEYYVFFHNGETYNISDETASQRWVDLKSVVGKNLRKELNFRPDHLPALEKFVADYKF